MSIWENWMQLELLWDLFKSYSKDLLNRDRSIKQKGRELEPWSQNELNSLGNNKTGLSGGRFCEDCRIDSTWDSFTCRERHFWQMHSVAFCSDFWAARLMGTTPRFGTAFKEARASYTAPLPGDNFIFLWGAQGIEMDVSEIRGWREEVQERG